MAFEDFVDGFSNADLSDLAGRINRNEVSPSLEAELRNLLEQVPMDDRQAAFDDKPAVVDVLVALGLDFTFPDGELETPEVDEVEEEARENGVAIEEAERPPDTAPDRGIAGPEALRPGARPREGVQPGEEIVRDASRLSGERIRRDLGLERAFMELMRDIGRGRQFDVFQPELYFRLTPDEQRRLYDFTVEEALQWLVRRRDITPSQLQARGFPDELIP